MNVSLAFGAKNVQYFTCFHPTGWDGGTGIVSNTGEKTVDLALDASVTSLELVSNGTEQTYTFKDGNLTLGTSSVRSKMRSASASWRSTISAKSRPSPTPSP